MDRKRIDQQATFLVSHLIVQHLPNHPEQAVRHGPDGGASAQARRYPAERFGAVARQLGERGVQALVTCVQREAALIEEIRPVAPWASYLIGQTTLPEYAALVERAALVICNNTLPMHLADGQPVSLQPTSGKALKDAMEAPERAIILEVLELNNWNRNATADALGINRTTLYKKMKRLGLMESPRHVRS